MSDPSNGPPGGVYGAGLPPGIAPPANPGPTASDDGPGPGGGQSVEPLAIVSVVLGIISLASNGCCCSMLALVTGPIGAALGMVSLTRLDKQGGGGKPYAWVGIGTNVAGTLIAVAALVLNLGSSALGGMLRGATPRPPPPATAPPLPPPVPAPLPPPVPAPAPAPLP